MADTKKIVAFSSADNTTDHTSEGTNRSETTDVANGGSFDSYDSCSSSGDEIDSDSYEDECSMQGRHSDKDEHEEKYEKAHDNGRNSGTEGSAHGSKNENNEQRPCSILSRKRTHDIDTGREFWYDGDGAGDNATSTAGTSRRRYQKRVRFSDGSMPGQPISPPTFKMQEADRSQELSVRPHQVTGSTHVVPEHSLQITTPTTAEVTSHCLLLTDPTNIIGTESANDFGHIFEAGNESNGHSDENHGISTVSANHDNHIVEFRNDTNEDDIADEDALDELDQLLARVESSNAVASTNDKTEDQEFQDDSDIRLAELDDEREQLMQRQLENRVSHLRRRISGARDVNTRNNDGDTMSQGKQVASELMAELLAKFLPEKHFDDHSKSRDCQSDN